MLIKSKRCFKIEIGTHRNFRKFPCLSGFLLNLVCFMASFYYRKFVLLNFFVVTFIGSVSMFEERVTFGCDINDHRVLLGMSFRKDFHFQNETSFEHSAKLFQLLSTPSHDILRTVSNRKFSAVYPKFIPCRRASVCP